MKKFLLTNWPIIILLFLAFLTRFWHLGVPAEVVFDEVHFGKFISAYFQHEFYFDIHPPLGKMMIAGFARIFSYEPASDFLQIGDSYDPLILRFLPAFFGSLLVGLIYLLARQTGITPKFAFFAGFLALFDNALLIQSRFILLDIFLLFFGFAGIYIFLVSRACPKKQGRIIFAVLSAIFIGLSFSVKWTGLSFLALVFVVIFYDFIKIKNIK
ncbi:MAG: phospholipid carrier-dependent glycosyltransferase, partial [bacterium]